MIANGVNGILGNVQWTVGMVHELIQEQKLWKKPMEERATESILKLSLVKRRSVQVNIFESSDMSGVT